MRSASARSSGERTPLRGVVPLVVGLGLWQLFGDPDSPYFPSPRSWVDDVTPLHEAGDLLPALAWTAGTFLAGLLLATAIGAVLGAVVGGHRQADRATGPTFEFLRSLPAAALVPLVVLILGYTTSAKLFLVVLPSVWPVLFACREARQSMSTLLVDVTRTLRLTRRQRVVKVMVPSLLPAVFLGMRVSTPIVLVVTILVEMMTRLHGLGDLLAGAQSFFQSGRVYGLLVIAGALGFVTNRLVAGVEDLVVARLVGHR